MLSAEEKAVNSPVWLMPATRGLTVGRAAINRWVSGSVRLGGSIEPPKSTSFLFNHFRGPKNPVSDGKGLVCGLHYSRPKGGRHENQNECEGWAAHR
jgi:hypothetical protein